MKEEPYFIILSILFVVLLLLSGFFSASEAAFFSLSDLTRSKLREETRRSSRRISQLLEKPRILLISIITSNTIVNVAAATIAAFLTVKISNNSGWNKNLTFFFEVIVVTFVLLVLSEVTPKIMAIRNPITFAHFASLPLVVVLFVIRPVSLFLNKIIDFLSKLIHSRDRTDDILTTDELKILLDMGEEQGELEAEEKEMIHSIFEFSETQVREVMVPRIDMVCVPGDIILSELIKIIKECGHTRIPVYQESVDNIYGIINAKELLPHVQCQNESIDLLKLARSPYFVPESKKIDELLREFQSAKTHMAIVVDEYGGTAGLITLEDVIEEIVGEIQDEYDEEAPLIRKIDDDTWISDAKINIYELNETLEANLPDENGYESLGGFIMHQTGHVPQKNATIDHSGYRFIVEEVKKNRIVKVRIKKMANPVNDLQKGPEPLSE